MDGSNNQFGQPVSRVGLLTATGAGSASVVLDENYNGFFTPTIAVSGIGVSSFSGTTGRGVMQFDTTQGGANSFGATIDLAFYVVDSTRIEVLSINRRGGSPAMPICRAEPSPAASVSSPYVFGISGNLATRFIDRVGEIYPCRRRPEQRSQRRRLLKEAYSASVPFSGTYAADTANNGHFTGSLHDERQNRQFCALVQQRAERRSC